MGTANPRAAGRSVVVEPSRRPPGHGRRHRPPGACSRRRHSLVASSCRPGRSPRRRTWPRSHRPHERSGARRRAARAPDTPRRLARLVSRAVARELVPHESFTQANASVSAEGVLRGLHLHRHQSDYWVVGSGLAFVALVDVLPMLEGAVHPLVETFEMAPDELVLHPARRRPWLPRRRGHGVALLRDQRVRRFGRVQVAFVGSHNVEAFAEAASFVRVADQWSERHGRHGLASCSHVIDFGSGWGRISRFLLAYVHPSSLYAIDVDVQMTALVNSTLAGVNAMYGRTAPPDRTPHRDGRRHPGLQRLLASLA